MAAVAGAAARGLLELAGPMFDSAATIACVPQAPRPASRTCG
jgi:hypothetical protein